MSSLRAALDKERQRRDRLQDDEEAWYRRDASTIVERLSAIFALVKGDVPPPVRVFMSEVARNPCASRPNCWICWHIGPERRYQAVTLEAKLLGTKSQYRPPQCGDLVLCVNARRASYQCSTEYVHSFFELGYDERDDFVRCVESDDAIAAALSEQFALAVKAVEDEKEKEE
jgi:hypothetical protein